MSDERKKYEIMVHGQRRTFLLTPKDAAQYKNAKEVEAPAHKDRTASTK